MQKVNGEEYTSVKSKESEKDQSSRERTFTEVLLMQNSKNVTQTTEITLTHTV